MCFCRRTKPSSKQKSTEEQELEKMQQLQQEVMELRKKNKESLKAAIAGAGGLCLNCRMKLHWAQLESAAQSCASTFENKHSRLCNKY